MSDPRPKTNPSPLTLIKRTKIPTTSQKPRKYTLKTTILKKITSSLGTKITDPVSQRIFQECRKDFMNWCLNPNRWKSSFTNPPTRRAPSMTHCNSLLRKRWKSTSWDTFCKNKNLSCKKLTPTLTPKKISTPVKKVPSNMNPIKRNELWHLLS